MEKKEEVVGRSKEVVELVGKIMLGAVGLCYAVGLVATNLYYSRYGVYTLSLFRLNYIVAGLWWLLPIFSLFLICFSIFYAVKERAFSDGVPLKRKLLSGGLGSVSLTIPATVILFFKIKLGVGDWVALIVGCLAVLGTLFACWYYVYRRRLLITPQLIVVFTIFFLYSCFLYTGAFAGRVYGRIPAHLGGGGTKDVQLLMDVNDSDKRFFELSGLLFYENSSWTQTAKVLFVTDNEYILVLEPYETKDVVNTLSIKRELIKSILYKGVRLPNAASSGNVTTIQPKSSPTVPSHISPTSPETSQTP